MIHQLNQLQNDPAARSEYDQQFREALLNFEKNIGVTFNNRKLLEQVFVRHGITHVLKDIGPANRQLEKRGDPLLKQHIAMWVDENKMRLTHVSSVMHNTLESNALLGSILLKLGMEKCLRLSTFDAHSQDENIQKQLLGSTVEAFLEALKRDQGDGAVKIFLNKFLFRAPIVTDTLMQLFDTNIQWEKKHKILEKLANVNVERRYFVGKKGRHFVAVKLEGEDKWSRGESRTEQRAEIVALHRFLHQHDWLLTGYKGQARVLFPLAIERK